MGRVVLDNITAAEYFWELVCEQVDNELLYGKFAFKVPEDCPFTEYLGKAVMIQLTEDGEYHVYGFDTFEEAARALDLSHVARIYH